MACTITDKGAKLCKTSAGIYTVYLATRPDTLYAPKDGTSTKIIDIDDKETAGTAIEFFPYTGVQKTTSFEEALMAANGSAGFAKKVAITIQGMSQENKNLLIPIETGYSCAIIKTKAGKYFLVGEWEALESSEDVATIAAETDGLNGYPLVLVCEEGERSNEIEADNIVIDASGTLTVTSV